MKRVILQSSDLELFAIEAEAAEKSVLLKNLLEVMPGGEDPITIPLVNAAILRKVIIWMQAHKVRQSQLWTQKSLIMNVSYFLLCMVIESLLQITAQNMCKSNYRRMREKRLLNQKEIFRTILTLQTLMQGQKGQLANPICQGAVSNFLM